MRGRSVAAVLACTVLSAIAGCVHQPAPQVAAGETTPAVQVPPPPPPVQELDPTSNAVRLQATIYEILMPPERIGELDAQKLATMNLAHLPPELGASRSLYLIDQKVSLSGDKIIVGTDEPMVSNTRMTDRGQTINTVRYESVGAVVDFKAERAGPRFLQVTSNLEIAAMTDSPVEVTTGVKTSVIRKSTMSLKGPVELGKPAVLISADASTRHSDGRAVVYVARIVLGVGQ